MEYGVFLEELLYPSRYDNSNDECPGPYGKISARLGSSKHIMFSTACSRDCKNSTGYMKEDACNDRGTQEGTGANHPAARNGKNFQLHSTTAIRR